MADVVARVVAWHNRHPLARRIAADQVGGVGVVALPFALRDAPAEAGGPDAVLHPVFGPDWMYRAAPARLHRWVRRHGRYPLSACSDWPLRQIEADLPLAHAADALGLAGRTLRHVITAVVDVDGRRIRVLVAPHAPLRRAAVFGARAWSLPRAGAAAALASGVLASVPFALLTATPDGAHQPLPATGVAAATPPAPAPSAAGLAEPVGESSRRIARAGQDARPPVVAAASAAAGATSAPTAPAPAGASPARDDEVAAPPAAPEPVRRPVDVPVTVQARTGGAAPLVALRPRLSEDQQRAARVAAEALRQAARPAAGARAVTAQTLATGQAFAIATLPAGSHDRALSLRDALQSLVRQTSTPVPTRLDLMEGRGGWRVVWWPHAQRAQADELVLAARARGLKVEVIAF